MDKFEISMDNRGYTSREECLQNAGKINNTIGRRAITITRANLKHYINLIGNQGHAFCPATFLNNKRNTENFKQMQLFVLDFDSKEGKEITFNEVKERAERYDLPILFAYETFRSVNCDRFRVAFLNDVSISDPKAATIMVNALHTIFPERDEACRDIVHMYFGGKNLFYFHPNVSTNTDNIDNDTYNSNISNTDTSIDTTTKTKNVTTNTIPGSNNHSNNHPDNPLHPLPKINIELLTRSMTFYLKNTRGDTHFRNHLNKFANDNGIKLNNHGLLDITTSDSFQESVPEGVGATTEGRENIHGSEGSERTNVSYIIIDIGENLPKLSNLPNTSKSYYIINLVNPDDNKFSHTPKPKRTPKNHAPHRSDTLGKIADTCRLFREFLTGTGTFGHNELWGISTNLIQVDAGQKLFMDTLIKHSYHKGDRQKLNRWNEHFYYNKRHDYKPQNCDKFCPYKDSCQHASNMLSTAKLKYRTIEKIANYKEQLYPLKEAREDFVTKFLAAVQSIEDSRHSTHYNTWEKGNTNTHPPSSPPFPNYPGTIHAIRSPVGIGKTTVVLKFMQQYPEFKCLFSFSSNDLKNEVYNKAKEMFPAVRSPSLGEIKDELPPNIWRRISSLYDRGLHRYVINYIDNLMFKEEVDTRCAGLLGSFMRELEKFNASNLNAFTTHARLLTLSHETLKKYDFIFIDEDIMLNSIIPNQAEILISELKEILEGIDKDSRLAYKIKAALKAVKTKKWITLPSIKYDDSYVKIPTYADLPAFCKAKKFYFRTRDDENNLEESNRPSDGLIFLKPAELRRGIHYVILSATIDPKICKLFFGFHTLIFYDCKKAEYKGTLNQYNEHTLSRADIAKKPGILDKLSEMTGVKDRITFKKYSKPGDLAYFGKTTGINGYEGKDLDVMGTPHHPEFVYKLIAFTHGNSFHDDSFANIYGNAKQLNQPIKHNGNMFHFYTFDKDIELLRNIQLWMINSELEQAVGRARLLRHDCTVNVFSNLLLNQANIRVINDRKDY